jgi:hypothetical protein
MARGHSKTNSHAMKSSALLAFPQKIQCVGTVAAEESLSAQRSGCVKPLPLLLMAHIE